MSYEIINSIPQFNFQINRILTYGNLACCREEVISHVAQVKTFEEWHTAWQKIAAKSEQERHYLHAAYYYRMAEFFLKSDMPEKNIAYKKCVENFYKAFDFELHLKYEKHRVPFMGKTLHCLKFSPPNAIGTVLVCGGYDSFIEEFVLQVSEFVKQRYEIILFEGPGQGKSLQENLYFSYDFEKAASAVLDYFGIRRCAMVGISWGGYFALRSAAYDKRITAAAAYDVMDNGLEVMTNIFPEPIRSAIRLSHKYHWQGVLNKLVIIIRKKSILADWAISQGLHITGTKTPYEFFQSISFHNLALTAELLTQDILLLAGAEDHYIPRNQFYRLKSSIHNAKSLTCRLFTKAEGGEQHCQIGNHQLAINAISDWLACYFVQ